MDSVESTRPAAAADAARSQMLYGAGLFGAAVAALSLVVPGGGTLALGDWPLALFFLAFGLFTISIGYSHPTAGYVSFDRVAQVSSILVLGPVDAAWINGLASLLYPWHRLRRGEPVRTVLAASLTNAGMMTLMILAGGLAYRLAGGIVPLDRIGVDLLLPLASLLVVMQLVNEMGMLLLFRLRRRSPVSTLTPFETLTELGAGVVGVLVAIVGTRLETSVLLLLLAVLSAVMLSLRRFADMRLRLERIVAERTDALREKTLELEHQATRDTLTGLFNRRYADEFLRREFMRARRHGHALSVALADIDHFKQVNDGHSHAVGDRALRRAAALLAGAVRSTDLVARYGGEEFVLCFTDTDDGEAAEICETLRRELESADWPTISPGLELTISFGVAAVRGEAGVEAVMATADQRLYQAKRSGRNRVVAGTNVIDPSSNGHQTPPGGAGAVPRR